MWYLTLFLILLVVVIALVWVKKAKRREFNIKLAKAYCKKHNLQFLDDSVEFISWYIGKDSNNSRVLIRQYSFSCSYDGLERLKGKIILQNQAVKEIYLEHSQYDIGSEYINPDQNKLNARSEDKMQDNIIAFRPRSEQKKD